MATLYAVIYSSSLAQPTAAQIKAGQDANGSAATWAGSVTSPTTTQVFDWPSIATGLTSSTSYKVSFVWSGATDSSVVTSAAFTTAAALAGSITGAATTSAALSTAIQLAASINAAGTTSASITTSIKLAAAVSAAGTASAGLSTAIQLAAAVSAAGTTSGAISTQITLAASASAAATVSGALTAPVSLAGSASCSATTSGEISTGIALAAAATCTATVSGSLDGGAADAVPVPVGGYGPVKRGARVAARINGKLLVGPYERITALIEDEARAQASKAVVEADAPKDVEEQVEQATAFARRQIVVEGRPSRKPTPDTSITAQALQDAYIRAYAAELIVARQRAADWIAAEIAARAIEDARRRAAEEDDMEAIEAMLMLI